MNTEAEHLAPTRRRGDRGASGPGLALAQTGEDDDTDYDYDATGTRLAARRDYRPTTRDYWRSTPPLGTPSGNIRRPGDEPGQPPATSPGGRAAGPLPGREAAAGVRPAGPRRLSPSLTSRTWHHRPGRGSARPDKETP
jgi:hypothetical protein